MKNSKRHFLPPIRYNPKTYPKTFACADTETDKRGYGFIFSVYGYNRKNEFISEVFTEHNWLKYKERVLSILHDFEVVYFHNLEYDVGAIFKQAFVNYECIFRHNGLLLLRLSKSTILRDSYALLPVSLAKIASELSTSKLEKKNRFSNEEYCLQDSKILYTAINNFFNVLKTNKINYANTTPSIFIKFLRQNINFNLKRLRSENKLMFVRNSYKGGRNEVFRFGVFDNVNIYDINSLYPYAMTKIRPAIPHACEENKKLNFDCFQIVHCRIEQKHYIPALCISNREKRLIFPNGSFDGYFTNEELKYLLENNYGKILKIYKTLDFEYLKSNPLKNCIEKLYSLRLASKTKFEKYTFKILMNGGYGKFGQWFFMPKYDKESGLIVSEKCELPIHANQIWASQITSKARMILHRYLVEYSDSLLYCDTDSVHLHKTKMDNRHIGNELGKFKIEQNNVQTEYKGCKIYRIGNIYKVKGVPKCSNVENHVKNCQCLHEKCFNEKSVVFKRPTKIRSCLRFGKELNLWVDIKKTLTFKYTKRIILNKNTKPLLME